MEDLSLHILDIAENSIVAGAHMIGISVHEDPPADLLSIEIEDDGRGMVPELVHVAADPFSTTRTERRIGLGLAFLKEAAARANGALEVRSRPGAGTLVRATFQRSHIDRQPLGCIPETIVALIANDAELEIVYRHSIGTKEFVFRTSDVRRQARGASLRSVHAMNAIREYLTREEEALVHQT